MDYVGEIKLYAGEIIPPGFMNCDGSSLPIPLYKELFAIIGYTYTTSGSGGLAGQKYFQLPNMTKGLIQGTKYIICFSGYFPRDRALSIYQNKTGDLVRSGKLTEDYVDPKQREITRYDELYWQNYNIDTDDFEEPR